MNIFFQRMNDDANIQSSADLFIQPDVTVYTASAARSKRLLPPVLLWRQESRP